MDSSVSSILNEVQKNAAAHEHHAKALCAVWRKNAPKFEAEFQDIVRLSVTITKVRPAFLDESLVDFFSNSRHDVLCR